MMSPWACTNVLCADEQLVMIPVLEEDGTFSCLYCGARVLPVKGVETESDGLDLDAEATVWTMLVMNQTSDK